MKIGDYVIVDVNSKGVIIDVLPGNKIDNNDYSMYKIKFDTFWYGEIESWVYGYLLNLDLERKRLEKFDLLKNI